MSILGLLGLGLLNIHSERRTPDSRQAPCRAGNPVVDCSRQLYMYSCSVHHEYQIQSARHDQVTLDLDKITRNFTDVQTTGTTGWYLLKRLEGQPVLTAHVLEYLLAHSEIIPESWKGLCVTFWGTVEHGSLSSDISVSCLCWDGHWYRAHCQLDDYWDSRHPAALLAR